MYTRKEARYYLAALIDGEGTVSDPESPKQSRSMRITNTDYELIEAAVECLGVLGVTCRVYSRSAKRCKRKPCWEVAVYGRANYKLLATLPLRSAAKRVRLEGLVASYRRPERPTDGELRRLLASGVCAESLASQLGVRKRTLLGWLRSSR